MDTIIAVLCIAVSLLAVFSLRLPRRRGAIIFALSWLLAGSIEDALLHPVWLILLFAALAVVLHDGLRLRLVSEPVRRTLAKMMPEMSDTEREALEAGTTWWEKELFSGRPDWQQFEDIELSTLSQREQAFIDNETEQLCAMLDEWQIQHELRDLPEEVWQFIKEKRFFSLIIPEEFGGLHFSPYAQSRVVSKIASRSSVAAVTVMVPNSLGPGELLAKYGTPEQQQYWLPRLASGEEIPCFGLTGPDAGSDAGAIPDYGEVCKGEYRGEETLGIKLSFSKRWITLAPIATVIGLAFRLHDPDGLLEGDSDLGICCALVPADLPGIDIGRRHNPGAAFMNGPLTGRDVFIPFELLIGGKDYIGKGWQMLVECLGAGRGISLPALSTAAGEMAYLSVGAYVRLRRQFGIPVGKFEGVQEATAEIAASAYTLEAFRAFVTRALADGAPSVLTAMAKCHATEMMRTLVNHSMDVLGGRGIQMGPRNFMALTYQTVPIAITVEGANILTRSLMIFGQGAIRCHPFLADEMLLLNDDSAEAPQRFDALFSAHLGHTASNVSRAMLLGFSGGRLSTAGQGKTLRRHYRQMERFAAAFTATADVVLVSLGGDLKRREMLSARLGDVHSQLVIASALLKFHHSQPHSDAAIAHADYALQRCFSAAQQALNALYANFPVPGLGPVLKRLFFPFGDAAKAPDDQQIRQLGELIMQPQAVRELLADKVYVSHNADESVGRVLETYRHLLDIEPLYERFLKAESRLSGTNRDARVTAAVAEGLITEEEAAVLRDYEAMRYDCMLTDAFDHSLQNLDLRPLRP